MRPVLTPALAPALARDKRANVAGFSLIEVLIAVAIASMGLVALFALQTELVDGQRIYERALARAATERNMLAALRGLNPVTQPQGRIDLPPYRQLVWASQPLGDFQQTTGVPAGDGPFQVRLYTVQAQMIDGSGRALQTLRFDRLGWRSIAPTTSSNPAGPAGAAMAGAPTAEEMAGANP